jgi:NADPH:quinone reductase-like Zn-dependent oxidoreductase
MQDRMHSTLRACVNDSEPARADIRPRTTSHANVMQMNLRVIALCVVVGLTAHWAISSPGDNMATLAKMRAAHKQLSLASRPRCVVVGGTNGIGRGIALRLAQAGGSVTVVGRSKESGESVVAEMRTRHPAGEHAFVQMDASLLRNAAEFGKM